MHRTLIATACLSVTDTGIWVSDDSGRRGFVPHSSVGSNKGLKYIAALSPKKDGLFALLAVPVPAA